MCSEAPLQRDARLVSPALVLASLVVLLLVSLLAVGDCNANETTEPAAVLLRNVYVPAGEPALWPTEGKTYLPVDAQRLGELRRTAAGLGAQVASVSMALLQATADLNGELRGTAALRIEVPPQSGGWLELQPGATPMRDARWRTNDQPVALGYWGARGATQTPLLGLQAEESDWIDFRWSYTPPSERGDSRSYRLALPRPLATQLLLDLPAAQTPVPLAGTGLVVVDLAAADKQQRELADQHFPTAGEVPPEYKRWLLFCGSGQSLRWRIDAAGTRTASRVALPTLTEQVNYMQDESGLELQQRMTLAKDAPLPKEIVLAAPRDLVLRSLTWDGQAVPARRDPIDGSYHIDLPSTPEPAAEESTAGEAAPAHQLVVAGWYPSPPNELARLPQVRMRDAYWSSGEIQLRLSPTLQLVDLQTEGLFQRPPDEQPSSTFLFSKTQANGHVQLQTKRRAAIESVRVGRVVQLSGRDSTATLLSEFQPSAGASAHLLVARLVGDWRLRNLTVNSPYTLDDWYVATNSNQERLLHVRVSKKLTAGNNEPAAYPDPFQLVVEASQSASAGDAWVSLRETVVLHWQEVYVAEDLLTIECDDGSEVELNPRPNELAEDVVMPRLGTLLPATTSGEVYDLAAIDSNTRVHLRTARATFDAEVVAKLVDGKDRWNQSFEIHCKPLRGLVTQVDINATGLLVDTLRWKRSGEDAWRLATRIVESTARSDDPAPQNTQWALVLPRPQAAEFTLVIDAPSSSSPACYVSPPEVLNARQQTTRCVVQSPEPRRIEVEATNWQLSSEPATMADTELGFVTPVHSAWLSDDEAAFRELKVERLGATLFVARAWIPRARLESTYTPNAAARHTYTLALRNYSETQLTCELPAESTAVAWRQVGGPAGSTPRKLAAVRPNGDSPQVVIPLVEPARSDKASAAAAAGSKNSPPGPQVLVYEIEFTTPGDSLAHGAKLTAPWPKLNIPVAESAWQLSYPRDYLLEETQTGRTPPRWQQRLFGILASSGHVSVDTPFTSASFSPLEVSKFTTVADDSISVTAIHAPTRSAQRGLVFISFLAAAYLLWRWPVRLIALLGVCAIAALLVPASWTGAATAAWGGALLATVLRGFRAARHHAPPLGQFDTTSTAPTTATLLLVALLSAATAHAEKPEPLIENVLIPMDSSGNVAGQQRFVSAEMLAELLRRERENNVTSKWRIDAPRTSASLTSDETGIKLAARDWEWSFDLQTLGDNVEVQLPLRQADAVWRRSLLLDGLPTPLMWNEDLESCRFVVPKAGRYRARLAFRPVVSRSSAYQQIRVRTIPAPHSEVVFDTAANLAGLELNGRAVPPTNGQPLVVPIDMEPQLEIRWATTEPESITDNWQVTQREWLAIEPDRYTIDYLLRIRGQATAAPPLELVSNYPGRRTDVAPPTTTTTQPTATRWTLRANRESSAEGETVFVARCQLEFERSPAWGRLRVPDLHVAGLPAANRRIAVSRDPDMLISSEQAVAEPSEELLEQLLSNWPNRQAAPPTLVLTTSAATDPQTATPSVMVRPRRSAPPPVETLSVCCAKRQLDIQYQGDFAAGRNPRFRHVFQVSPNLEVTTVAIRQQGLLTPAEFSRPQPDRLVVFFPRPMVEAFGLSIVGKFPLLAAPTAEVPTLASVVRGRDPQRLSLYCKPSFSAKLVSTTTAEGAENLQPLVLQMPMEVPADWNAYGIGSYLLVPQQFSPHLIEITDNNPQFETSVLTTLVPNDGEWIADLGVVVEVKRDTLPGLTLTWPEQLTGQPTVTPSAYVSSEPIENSSNRRLRIRFTEPVKAGQVHRLTLRSAFRPTDVRTPRYPLLFTPDAARQSSYFGLLPVSGGKWIATGASPTVAPASIEGLLATWPDAQLLEATAAGPPVVRWQAELDNRPVQRLPLATINVELASRGGSLLTTTLTVPPLEGDRCSLRIPAGQQLLVVRVDGRPAIARQHTADHYVLQLPDGSVPHLVTTLTKTRAPFAPGGTQAFEFPRIWSNDSQLQPEQTVWSVTPPSQAVRLSSPSGEVLPAVDLAALVLNQTLQAATDRARNGTTSANGAATWAAELTRHETALRSALRENPPQSGDVVAQPEPNAEYDDLLTRVANEVSRLQALGTPAASRAVSQSAGGSSAWGDTNQHDLAGEPRLVRGVAASGFTFAQPSGDPLVVRSRLDTPSDTTTRGLLALATLILATVAIAATKHWQFQLPTHEMLFPVAIVVGLAWWLLLWPRLVGLLIAVVAAVAWIRYTQVSRTAKQAEET